MKYKLIPKSTRIAIRNEAIHCLVLACGDGDKAARIARIRIKPIVKKQLGSIVSTFLVGLAIKLAIELIKYWIVNALSSVKRGGFQTGEPGA